MLAAIIAVLAVPAAAEDLPTATGDEPGKLLKTLKDRSAGQRWGSLRDLFSKPAPQRTARRSIENPASNSPTLLPDGTTIPQSPPFPSAFNATDPPVPPAGAVILLQPKTTPVQPKNRQPTQLRKLTDILPYEDYQPDDVAQVNRVPETFWKTEAYQPRKFENALYAWEAADLSHYPLYFEDPALERYGHTYPDVLQPFASAARFGVQLIGIPYQAAIDPVRKPVYTLGWYRPGECAPKLFYQIPWNPRAAAVQAGVTTGLFYLIP